MQCLSNATITDTFSVDNGYILYPRVYGYTTVINQVSVSFLPLFTYCGLGGFVKLGNFFSLYLKVVLDNPRGANGAWIRS